MYFPENIEKSRAILKSGIVDPDRLLRVIKYDLANDGFDPDYMRRDAKIRLTYHVIIEDHDGYCSDGYDFVTNKKTITKIYPLLKMFTTDDIINHGGILSISLDNPKLNYYEIDDIPHGNGYCGSVTSHNIISTKILIQSD